MGWRMIEVSPVGADAVCGETPGAYTCTQCKKTYNGSPIDITARKPAAGERDLADGEKTHGGTAGNTARATCCHVGR
jgi:hypothetical protein